jgi:hypothetical protein
MATIVMVLLTPMGLHPRWRKVFAMAAMDRAIKKEFIKITKRKKRPDILGV